MISRLKSLCVPSTIDDELKENLEFELVVHEVTAN